ncbi:MAG: glycoside hydrolase family 99-like domain-containing protein [Dysgonamonadaceae bacterium]|jgi:lipopolysaccharide biosynthesis protein|nr:glycoside hydrolase family 99-like domain-containing protein [Dysgonamonadaceae bacterium]
MQKIRVIALYLPQFHPIPENDLWWGKGFTEWTNVGKAKSLFRGHYQPRVPADLGYYDLRLPEVRQAQADLAQEYGVEGFCYWHYWFASGKKLLERPFSEVLLSGKPDFPFCLGWANHSWKGKYSGVNNKNALIEQQYNGVEEYATHFYEVLPAFKDKRYITVDGKPFFLIFDPEFQDAPVFIDCWQKLAVDNGLPGIHFVAHTYQSGRIPALLKAGFDAVNVVRLFDYQRVGISLLQQVINKIKREVFNTGFYPEYRDAMRFFSGEEDAEPHVYPTVVPDWDHSPRTGAYGSILKNASPELFGKHLARTFNDVKTKPQQQRIVIIKSWNEWGEGNYMEPDLKFGRKYLDALKKAIENVAGEP